jgi:POT family proton-dependent oligopeptide transporter
VTTPAAARLPPQIPYIIGNEGCERFSFYGMRNILTQFLVSSALLFTVDAAIPQAEREGAAKEVFHTFVIGVYLFPLLGGWISDRFLGKYRTILWLSLVYCAGPRLPLDLREPEGGLLPRAVLDRAGQRRHQAVRLGVRG